eukprot:TRINITY_DN20757_c0_g1_i1.p1 TRINITY_DN20757_c0_g1~~TRINITY_DN20757_c0_g1_i1.p1  ORF type:complete len:795 (-),score=104.12 TRINITY_DN20757_c0_g1_i1:46-2430(-)
MSGADSAEEGESVRDVVAGEDRDDSSDVYGHRKALVSLVVDHLESEGVPTRLVTQVRQQLKSSLVTRESGNVKDSDLVRFIRLNNRDWSTSGTRVDAGNGDVAVARVSTLAASGSCIRVGGDCDVSCARALSDAGAVPKVLVGASLRRPLLGRRAMLRTLILAMPVFLISLIYLPCVTYSEYYMDELFALVRNPDARGETPLRELVSHDFWGRSLEGFTHKSYRPLVVLSFALQCRLSGVVKIQPQRAFNVALHATNSLLLHVLMRRGGTSWHWATLAAALFAVHPVHAENVIYLVGRADALATFCWLLALVTWPPVGVVGHRRLSLSRLLRISLAVALAVSSGLCKETGFCVLVQLAVTEILGMSPLRGSVPLLGSFCLVFMWRSWLTDGSKAGFSEIDTPVPYDDDVVVRCFSYLYIHSKYAQLMVFPWALCSEYSLDAIPLLRATWRDVRVLAVLTSYLGVVALASWGFVARSRRVLVGLSNVLVPFVPVSNLFFVVGTTIGERLLYPCNVGGAMVLAAVATSRAGGRSSGSGRERGGRRLFFLGMLLLCVFAGRCGLRVYHWSSKELLFGQDAANYPRVAKIRHSIGDVLRKQNRLDEAMNHFSATLEIAPKIAMTEHLLAEILIETGRPHEAVVRLANVIKGPRLGFIESAQYHIFVNTGFALVLMGNYEGSLEPLLVGLSLNENVPHALNALGFSYMMLGRLQEAVTAFERGLHYHSSHPYLMNNFGVALVRMGDLKSGSEHIIKAATLRPSVPAFVHNIKFLSFVSRNGQFPPNEALKLDLSFVRTG